MHQAGTTKRLTPNKTAIVTTTLIRVRKDILELPSFLPWFQDMDKENRVQALKDALKEIGLSSITESVFGSSWSMSCLFHAVF